MVDSGLTVYLLVLVDMVEETMVVAMGALTASAVVVLVETVWVEVLVETVWVEVAVVVVVVVVQQVSQVVP